MISSKCSCPSCGRGLKEFNPMKKFMKCSSCGKELHIKRDKRGRCKSITIVQRPKPKERR